MKSPFGYYGAGVLLVLKTELVSNAIFIQNYLGKIEAPGGKWELVDGKDLDLKTEAGQNISLARNAKRELEERMKKYEQQTETKEKAQRAGFYMDKITIFRITSGTLGFS